MSSQASYNRTRRQLGRLILLLAPLLAITLLWWCGCGGPVESAVALAKADGKRVVVLGFDGMDHDLVGRYMDEGKLPSFARLRDEGVFRPLLSSTPPESPVAWSTFVTGTNPGKTGIFDFLRRNPETYFPELNMTDIVSKAEFLFDTVPTKPPELRNCRRGRSFWGYASDAGISTTGIMMPMNMPPESSPGARILSGLGVPDIRRTMGTYVYYVDDLDVAKRSAGSTHGTEMGGRVIEVVRDGNDLESFLPGPWHPIHANEEISASVEMTLNPSGRALQFRILNETPFRFLTFFGGAIVSLIVALALWAILARVLHGTARGFATSFVIFILALVVLWTISRPTKATRVVEVSEGEWSEWIPAKYLVTDWVGIEGFFRLYLIEVEPEFQLYATPVSIDPRGTATALSFPNEYALSLLNQYGYFKTYGWDSETWALNENVIDEDVFLDDLLENWDIKAKMVLEQMHRDDWTIFSAVFQGTDHTSHMFWRFLDPEHPMYDPALAEKYGDAILTVYQRADTLVGEVLDDVLDDDDELIVMSDHGFNSFRKAVNLNRWLLDNGFLAEKRSVLGSVLGGGQQSSVYELFSPGSQFFGWVDWSRSKAYALGLGQVYVNLEGRELKGIVTENERSDLIDEIIEGLREMRDPETGEQVIVDAYRGDEVYHGDNMEYAPDIVVGFAPGYRVSWQTCLGVAAEHLVEPNERKWSGDHCSFDPDHTLGILFSTVPITVDDPCLVDLTPSVLSLVGVDKPARCDGRVIF